MDDEDLKPVVTFELTIGRTIHVDGQQGFYISTSEPEYSFIEILGLLDAAKWQMFNQMTRSYGE